jgi:hypothetical protein
MGVGSNAELGVNSYVAFWKETTWGTFPATAATGSSSMEPLMIGFKTEITNQKLEAISRNRGFTKRVQLDKNVSGTLEQYLHPIESVLPLAVALGGGISSASLSGGFVHSLSAGNFDTLPSSLSFQVRKGLTHHWQYTGGRVNNCVITAAIGEPVKVSYEFMFKDSTQSGTDISGSLSISAILPFTYVQGTYRYAGTEASITSTAVECITGFELSIVNNLKNDATARCLGSNVLAVLPPTRRAIEFKITQRFDTLTAWNRFINNEQGSVELLFVGQSISAKQNYTCQIRLPKVHINTPDPEVTGPNDILTPEITFDVLVDNPMTSTGRDIGVTIINATQTY